MRTLELAATTWSEYLALISRDSAGAPTRVAIAGAAGGREARTWPLRRISFERATDTIELSVGGVASGPTLRYFLGHPRHVAVRETSARRRITIIDARGVQTLVEVTRPRRLDARGETLLEVARPRRRRELRCRPVAPGARRRGCH